MCVITPLCQLVTLVLGLHASMAYYGLWLDYHGLCKSFMPPGVYILIFVQSTNPTHFTRRASKAFTRSANNFSLSLINSSMKVVTKWMWLRRNFSSVSQNIYVRIALFMPKTVSRSIQIIHNHSYLTRVLKNTYIIITLAIFQNALLFKLSLVKIGHGA